MQRRTKYLTALCLSALGLATATLVSAAAIENTGDVLGPQRPIVTGSADVKPLAATHATTSSPERGARAAERRTTAHAVPQASTSAEHAAGASARLRAAITNGQRPRGATLTFTSGPNRGLTLDVGRDGQLDSPPLYPGFGTYRLDAGANSCERELVLRHAATTSLELDFGDYGDLAGTVRGDDDEPVAGARVTLDGKRTWTDRDGHFALARNVSGPGLLLVHADGYCAYREQVVAGEREPRQARLERGTGLKLAVSGAGQGPVVVYVLPTGGQRMSGRRPSPAYPWHELNPIELGAQRAQFDRVELTNLPSTRVALIAFSTDAKSAPVVAWLTPGEPAALTLELVPLSRISGRVVRANRPVADARLVLAHTNPVRATQLGLGALGRHYLSQPIELLPSTRQQRTTSADGRYDFADWGLRSDAGLLTVTSASEQHHFEVGALRAVDFTIDLAGD